MPTSSKKKQEPVGRTEVTPSGPADLPADPAVFWAEGASLDELSPPAEVDSTPALKRLGPLPVARGGFPLVGFLTTVYEHVAEHVGVQSMREPFKAPSTP